MYPKQKTYTVEQARAKMEQFCAYQERSHKEVLEKLRQMRMIPQAIDQIMVHLIEQNFLSEERFATNFAWGKFSVKKWGKLRIKHELKMRGISPFLIQKALEEIQPEDYRESFEELSMQKFQSFMGKTGFKEKKKWVDYMLYRGWEPDWVFEKANELFA